jgi:hypothetical protein
MPKVALSSVQGACRAPRFLSENEPQNIDKKLNIRFHNVPKLAGPTRGFKKVLRPEISQGG